MCFTTFNSKKKKNSRSILLSLMISQQLSKTHLQAKFLANLYDTNSFQVMTFILGQIDCFTLSDCYKIEKLL